MIKLFSTAVVLGIFVATAAAQQSADPMPGANVPSATMAAPSQPSLTETTTLADDVAAGTIPPVAARVPLNPRIVEVAAMDRQPGRHGGKLRMLMGDQKDIRWVPVYGYSRLVVYDRGYKLKPDILERVDVAEGRIYTLTLRQGHKWSDGHPFTTADFRYYWEDVANNKKLSKGGPNIAFYAGGELPQVEYLSETQVRFTWPVPNPLFLPSLAEAQPLTLYLPAHYLKQFHVDYQDASKLDELVAAAKVKDWTSLHTRLSRQTRPENPDLPTLDPWVVRTAPPAEVFTFARNPYFHRVDENGLQLPYIDEVELATGTSSLIAAKAATGEADLQARYLSFDDYTFLKESDDEHQYQVTLWQVGAGSQIALVPNLNANDPVWREVLRDVRFRRALSLGINRREINQAIYYGLARESANTILPQSPLYDEAFSAAWAEFDLERANALLDEMGLDRRDDDGVRLLPDGRRAEIVVANASESTEASDVVELVHDSWFDIGIKIYPRTSQLEVFRNRFFAGETLMGVTKGLDNALVVPAMSPAELAPTAQQQLQWPKWGLYNETSGEKGEAPDLPEAQQLLDLYAQWTKTRDDDERARIWSEMLALYTDQVFTIGTVNGCSQPVVVADTLRNVPETGIYAYDPGGYFGIYMPDTFWFDQSN